MLGMETDDGVECRLTILVDPTAQSTGDLVSKFDEHRFPNRGIG